MNLAEKLEEAKATVALLEQQAAIAKCHEFGRHRMVSVGGVNCGCEFQDGDGNWFSGQCSVPVNSCSVCGGSDYGLNDEAVQIKNRCREERS